VKYERRNNPAAVEGQVFSGLRDLIQFRKTHSVFYGNELEVLQTENEHVLGYIRTHGNQQAVILANFSESKQSIPARVLEELQLGLDRDAGTHGLTLEEDFILAPLELRILTPQPTRQAAAL
jgi:amylosucrase